MNCNLIEKRIEYLKLNDTINNVLKENNINSIEDLWVKTRSNLKKIGLNDTQIKEIIIKLELIGLDLNKKTNK